MIISKHNMTKHLFFAAIALLGVGCGSDPVDTEVVLDDVAKDSVTIAPEVLNDLVGSIPSPVEMSTVLMASGAEFNDGLLNSVDHVDRYSTADQKAFNLGVYGADLAYINNHGKVLSAVNVLGGIKRLADDLRIGHLFDMETLRRLCTNSKDVDSLIYLSTANFNAINEHLRANERSNLSVLMVCGAWVEGMHIAADAYRTQPGEDIQRILAEQKVVLDKLKVVLDAFPSDPYFAQLSASLGQVKTEFDRIEITSEYHAPTKKVVNGRLVVQDNSVTTFNVPAGVMDALLARIAETRNTFIQ